MVGQRYAYAPPNGTIPRPVQVCGATWGKEKPATFLIKYVLPSGQLNTPCTEVLGWFKSIRALPKGRANMRQIDPQGRVRKQLALKIEELIA